ncbi:hypothetical protein U9M48_036821, partial [Paspalum notatum var. saurae]
MPGDKAPGPDGFTGAFFSKCWDIVKGDLLSAANAFHLLRTSNLAIVNTANIVLIPKKEGATSVADYRPISLIHSFAKIISKVLAMRLAPLMNSIVSPNQSAFIKGCNIHESFLAVRSTVRRLNNSRTSALFIKLDISKAFDSVRWDYLLNLLKELGFPTRWCDWVATLLSMATSRVLINGVPCAPIRHGRGLRQGDPLSPLLFVISIDPLQKLLDLAASSGCLGKLRGRTPTLRVSLYADDTAIFVKPTQKDVTALSRLLRNFGDTSGLLDNAQKSTVVPIRCGGLDLTAILTNFEAQTKQFPIKYLGLPLSHKCLRRVDFQPLVDKMANKLTTLEREAIKPRGPLKLVLTSQAIYSITSLSPPKSTLREIDGMRKRFLWAGAEALTGAKCKVNWLRSARPLDLGGLGVLHLGFFARALRLRWLWRKWIGRQSLELQAETPCTKKDKLLFAAATSFSIGSMPLRPSSKLNRIWTSDRLQARGWANQGHCPLCRHSPESAFHLLAECRFTKRLWKELSSWTANLELDPTNWEPSADLHQWWTNTAAVPSASKKGLRSLIILVCWEIWKERNSRVFNRAEAPLNRVLSKIKDEAGLWSLVGAKGLAIDDDMDDSNGTRLSGDALAAVFILLSDDAAAVVRCAATCRRWASVVSKNAGVLSRALPPLPTMALGFFHDQDTSTPRVRYNHNHNKRRKLLSAAADPAASFVPTAWDTPRHVLRVLSNMRRPSSPFAAGGARAVACRNGRVVLELQRHARDAGLRLSVWNPMTGDEAPLPPLSGDDKPGVYACALLTGEDLEEPPPTTRRPTSTSSPGFFRVLIVHNRRGFTALRTYSSDTGSWSAEARLDGRSPKKLKSDQLRELGQAVVIRGVAYWHLSLRLQEEEGGAAADALFAVRFDTPEPPAHVTSMPPPAFNYNFNRSYGLLGTTRDGKLCSIRAGFCAGYLSVGRTVWEEADDGTEGRWERKGRHVTFTHITLRCSDRLHLRWFCEKSGILFLTLLGDGCAYPGTFALNLATSKIDRVCDAIDDDACNSRSCFIGYEMDRASYLASIA